MNSINNTNTSDNSSDSNSNNKKTSIKSEIEIVDQKIIKCFNEMNHLEQKIQREWSKQMNSHLKSFYQDDSIASDHQNDSSYQNSFHTPQHQNDSSEYKKRIIMLSKKLRTYEKRRQKLLYENKKEKEQQEQSNAVSLMATEASDSNAPASATQLNGQQNALISQASTLPTSLTSNALLNSKQSFRNGSFVFNTSHPLMKSMNGADEFNAAAKQTQNSEIGENAAAATTTGKQQRGETSVFYLNSEGAATNPTIKLINVSNTSGNEYEAANGGEMGAGEIGQNGNMINAKTYQAIDRSMLFQIEQQLYYLTKMQEKIQSDMEDLEKKLQDNQQVMLKELQNTCNQISDHVHKISFNFYKSFDSKIEDFKGSFDRSIQSFSYNLTHCHRDIKEVKDDVSYMKNKIEILEKSQKVTNIETNPTNYYQLFYKLLDILLTLATIILLAFTNMIASIKFVFMLYPRSIVIILFLYFLFYYLVDIEKVDMYFHRVLFNELDPHSKLNQNNKFASNQASFVISFIRTFYGYFFPFKSKDGSSAVDNT